MRPAGSLRTFLREQRLNTQETVSWALESPCRTIQFPGLQQRWYESTIGRCFRSGTRSLNRTLSRRTNRGGSLLRTTAMSTPSKPPVNVLDRPTQDSATRSFFKSAETFASQTHRVSAEVPIGVLEVPVGVWGSRRIVSSSGQPGRIDLFAEETCTVIVFPHGAVIRLSVAVAPGQMMMVVNRKSRQVVPCRVVNVRNFPNVRGYAEIEFFQSVTGFWGSYTPQGTLKLTARIPSATPEKPPKPGPDSTRPASTQARIMTPSDPSPKPPPVVSMPPDDFLSSSLPKKAVSVFANAATASPTPPPIVRNKVESIESHAIQIPSVEKPVQRPDMVATPSESPFDAMKQNVSKPNPLLSLALANSSKLAVTSTQELQRGESGSERSGRSWIWGVSGPLLGQIIARTATERRPSPRSRMVFVWVIVTSLFMIGAAGIFLPHHGTAQSAATAQTNPTPAASTVSSIANTTQSLQPESNSSSVVPLPIIAKTESFPGTHGRELADDVRISQPPVRTPNLERKIPNGNLLARPLAPRRSAAAIGRAVPPDLTGVDSNTGAGVLQGILGASPRLSGRMKEPQLVSRSVPSYPAMAKQAGIEGEVTIDAVIDNTGKLTSMKVVSGALMLQQAALDSLRNWKYEPGYLDDKPVPVRTSITVKFRLR
jgi:TonB family protein